MNKITNLILKISNYGVNDETSQGDARHIQFANYCSIISILGIIVFCTLDSIVAFDRLKEPIFISLLYIPFFLLTIYLNKRGLYAASRNLFAFLCISLTFIIAAFYFGKEVREHSLFILFAGVALLVNPVRNWKTILVIAFVCIAAFLYIELIVDSSKVKTPYPIQHVTAYRIFTNLFAFVTFILILVIYEVRITQKEEIIESQMNDLIEINKALLQINAEVRLNHELLAKSNSAKDQMFSIIAHDLRSPIGTIMATSEIVSQSIKKGDSGTAEFFTDNLKEASKNTFSLLEDLITWARTQINSVNYNPVHLNLNKVIPELLKFFQESLDLKSLKVEVNNLDLDVYADNYVINTVLRNIISKAIKFSPPHDRIVISACHADGMTEIRVRDFGTGMTDRLKNEIMEGQKITSMPGTSGERGTGLGLSICRELLSKNGGKLRIESEINKGTEFIISFPLSATV